MYLSEKLKYICPKQNFQIIFVWVKEIFCSLVFDNNVVTFITYNAYKRTNTGKITTSCFFAVLLSSFSSSSFFCSDCRKLSLQTVYLSQLQSCMHCSVVYAVLNWSAALVMMCTWNGVICGKQTVRRKTDLDCFCIFFSFRLFFTEHVNMLYYK